MALSFLQFFRIWRCMKVIQIHMSMLNMRGLILKMQKARGHWQKPTLIAYFLFQVVHFCIEMFYSSITLTLLLNYTLNYFSFIIDGCKFTSIAQMVTTELTYGLHERGITPLRKLNNFSCLIMRSIWTLDVATHLVAVYAGPHTLFLRIIGGAISTVSCKAKRSWMLSPHQPLQRHLGSVFQGNHRHLQSPCRWYFHCTILRQN